MQGSALSSEHSPAQKYTYRFGRSRRCSSLPRGLNREGNLKGSDSCTGRRTESAEPSLQRVNYSRYNKTSTAICGSMCYPRQAGIGVLGVIPSPSWEFRCFTVQTFPLQGIALHPGCFLPIRIQQTLHRL